MDRLTAEDRLMLWGDAVWPQEIGALAVLEGERLLDADGRLRIEGLREVTTSPRRPSRRRGISSSTTSAGGPRSWGTP